MDVNAETSPQAEKVRGFTRLYHDLHDPILKLKLALSQVLTIFAILKKTVGQNKSEECLSITDLANMLDCDRRNMADGLNDLVDRKIILQRTSGQRRFFSVNEKTEEWITTKAKGGYRKVSRTVGSPTNSAVGSTTNGTVGSTTNSEKGSAVGSTTNSTVGSATTSTVGSTTNSTVGSTTNGTVGSTTNTVIKKEELKESDKEKREEKKEEKPVSLSIPTEPFSYTGKMDVLACMNYYQLEVKGFTTFDDIRSFQGMMDDELIHAAIKIAFRKQDVYCKGILNNWNKQGYRKVSEVPELKKGGDGNGGIPVAGGVNQGNRMGRANRAATKAPEISDEESAAIDKRLEEALKRHNAAKLPK